MSDGPLLWRMTPRELAQNGIPVEVALRARLEDLQQMAYHAFDVDQALTAYRDALAIIEASCDPRWREVADDLAGAIHMVLADVDSGAEPEWHVLLVALLRYERETHR